MTVKNEIEAALQQAFAPKELVVEDVSEAHRGHAGFREGGETHFDVRIVAEIFKGQNRVARHRSVHAALGKDLIGRIHALSLDLSE